MANDVTVDIKGRVDRTDTYTDEGRLFVKVLDYKSGNTVFDLVKLYYGTHFSLQCTWTPSWNKRKRR